MCWKSKMQQSVTLSSCEAEYVAASQCLCEMLFIKQIAESIGIKVKTPMKLYTDNTGVINLSKNFTASMRTRHVDIRHHHVCDHSEQKNVDLCYVPTDKNISDMLTKNLCGPSYNAHCSKLDNPTIIQLGEDVENEI